MSSRPRTMYEKIWDAHVVSRRPDGTCLIYIDRHLVHEVTSPQAFEGLRLANRPVHGALGSLAFAAAHFRQHGLLDGLDEIALTLADDPANGVYEQAAASQRPWQTPRPLPASA